VLCKNSKETVSKLAAGRVFYGSSANDSRRTSELGNRAFARPVVKTITFKAIAFDYSGLLVDDILLTLEVVNKVFGKFGIPKIGLEEFQQEFKLPYYTIFTNRGISKRVAIEVSSKIYKETYPAYENAIRPFDDVIPCIRALAKLDVKLAIVSQTPRQQLEYQLERFGLSKYFSSIIALGECAREKPDPLPLQETARRLGVRPEDLLYAGDMYEDIECARMACANSVAVSRPGGSYHMRDRLLEARSDLMVPDLRSLANFLRYGGMTPAA
jgi:HAD superfamily hydrolase (TIGR01549 family)